MKRKRNVTAIFLIRGVPSVASGIFYIIGGKRDHQACNEQATGRAAAMILIIAALTLR